MAGFATQHRNAAMTYLHLEGIRLAQRQWAIVPVVRRLRIIRNLRHRIAAGATALAETVPTSLPGALHRTVADTLAAEVLPLLEACRFLEREGKTILRPRHIGEDGRPVLLGRVTAEVERTPWGIVLILAPANYPLLLPGVQALQALAAGNAVLWKPAPGTETCAFALKTLLAESGLDPDLLTVLPSKIEAAETAINAGVDHVVLTGSAETGKAVLRRLAETLTPSTMELSGCDAAFVLPGADLDRTIRALVFGLRFNGSATCMAPRRVFLVGLAEAEAVQFESGLAAALAEIGPAPLSPAAEDHLCAILADAHEQQAEVALHGFSDVGQSGAARPTLILHATPSLAAMRENIFAPILSVMRTVDLDEAFAAYAACPYALAASIFGPEHEARRFSRNLHAGNIVINDLIIPTADPRIPFGGRGRSGFGVTRGVEGLLAMTTPRTVQIRHGKPSEQIYAPTGEHHAAFFARLAAALHASRLGDRWTGLKRALRAARKLR